ncbi:hypothetical protein Godav_021949 [Gossypium davidsonii]|uniref:Pentatricopeptide repeat-containing protein n=2 Tax=Gossypium TaxID=3633 RepID=A0A7J8TAN6_GOSDV|nr:hypothetical protein [Gossypium davidsonii]MBA0671794.1 hypothetical protein [Gossypium klotzschianum]
MLKLGVEPDVVTFTTLINGLCKQRKMSQAASLFDEMIGTGYQPNLIAYSTILNEERGFKPDIVAYSTVIDCLCKKGSLNEALDLFSEMMVKGIRPNIVTYSCLIHAMCNSGQQKQATRLLNEMVDNNISPKGNDF